VDANRFHINYMNRRKTMMFIKQHANPPKWPVLPIGVALLVCAVIGAALAGWLDNGPQLLVTLSANALAWCF
jgi:hypothetical protein